MQTFKSIMKILIISALVVAIYMSGMYSAKYQQNQKEKKSTISTIAVVNADIGTIVEGERVFYATDLMIFPDTNFKSVGLEDAREGIVDGRYAAYVLIPEGFSESIESVNREPNKAQITYALHDNLRQDVQIKVVNDIHNFILTLSNNISYIYVDAILEEMHAIQDDSKTIMKNDVEDMESIIGVETADLIEEIEYEPLAVTEIEIEYMDLSDEYESVYGTVENIYQTYLSNMELAEEDFVLIKEDGTAVGNLLATTTDTFSTIDILTDEEGNCVYESGLTELLGITAKYEAGKKKKKEAQRSLGYYEEVDTGDEDDKQFELGEKIYVSKDDLLNQVNDQIDSLKSIRTALGNSEDVEEDMKATIQALEELKEQINKYYTDALNAVNNIPVVDELPDDVDRIVREEIATKIMDEVAVEEEKVITSAGTLLVLVDEYVTRLDEYDAVSYLEKEKIDEYLSSLFVTIDEMETDIMEQDELYMNYVDEVTRVTDSNVQTLQENIDTAYTKTQENINNTLEKFKENRTNMNALNVSLLDGITKKLPYTRLGNLEYTQVYDFIAQPVVSTDESIIKNEITDTSVNMDRVDLICMFLGIMALIFLYVMVQLIHTKMLKQKVKGEEEELCMTE